MRFPKNVINAFAILGVVSFIVFACAAAEEAMSNDDPVVVNDPNSDPNNELPVVTTGQYQMQMDRNGFVIAVLNTETGGIKVWYRDDLNSNTDSGVNLGFTMRRSFAGW